MTIEIKLDDGSILQFNTHNKITYSNFPNIYSLDNFISNNECEHIIKTAKPHLIYNNTKICKGKTCRFKYNYDTTFENIGNKISNEIGYSIKNMEYFQVSCYNVGEESKPHYDSWKQDGSPEHLNNFKFGGNRLVTVVLYLNNVIEGGETKMTKLNKLVIPKQGKILFLENCDKGTNNQNEVSEYCSMPLLNGIKYVLTIWFKETECEVLYKNLYPNYFNKWTNNKTSSLNKINKSNIYNKVIQLMEQNNLTKEWDDYNKYIDIIDCSLPKLHQQVVEYLGLREKETAIINSNIFNNEFEINPIPCFWKCSNVFKYDILEYIKNYYSELKLLKRSDGPKYYFVKDELITSIIQFDLISLVEYIVKDKIKPLSCNIVKYNKGYKQSPSTYNAKYIALLVLKGDSPLMLHTEPILNKHYNGKYYMIKEDYKTINYGENEILIYRADQYITKRNSITNFYYGIEFLYR